MVVASRTNECVYTRIEERESAAPLGTADWAAERRGELDTRREARAGRIGLRGSTQWY